MPATVALAAVAAALLISVEEVSARLRTASAWRKLGGRLGGQRPVEQISRGT